MGLRVRVFREIFRVCIIIVMRGVSLVCMGVEFFGEKRRSGAWGRVLVCSTDG